MLIYACVFCSEHSGFSRTTHSLAHINPSIEDFTISQSLISNHKSKHRKSLLCYKNQRFTFYSLLSKSEIRV